MLCLEFLSCAFDACHISLQGVSRCVWHLLRILDSILPFIHSRDSWGQTSAGRRISHFPMLRRVENTVDGKANVQILGRAAHLKLDQLSCVGGKLFGGGALPWSPPGGGHQQLSSLKLSPTPQPPEPMSCPSSSACCCTSSVQTMGRSSSLSCPSMFRRLLLLQNCATPQNFPSDGPFGTRPRQAFSPPSPSFPSRVACVASFGLLAAVPFLVAAAFFGRIAVSPNPRRHQRPTQAPIIRLIDLDRTSRVLSPLHLGAGIFRWLASR